MKKQWKLDNKGMTLLEVIVAFAIFAIAATILISYFGGALRIIGNSNALKDASQKGTSDLEMSDLDSEEEKALGKNVKKVSGSVKVWKDETTYNNGTATSQYIVSGNFFTATEKKNNDQTEVLQQVFKPNANSGFTPKPVDPVDPIVPQEWKEEEIYKKDDKVSCDGKFYRYYNETPNKATQSTKPTSVGGQTLWVRFNGPNEEWIKWESLSISHVGYDYGAKVVYTDASGKETYWVCIEGNPTGSIYPPGTVGTHNNWARINGNNEGELLWVENQTYFTGALLRYTDGNLYKNVGNPTLSSPDKDKVNWVVMN